MRTVILIMIAILLTGCRSKKVVTSVISEKEIVQETAINKAENKVEKIEDKWQSKTAETLERKKDNQTDFELNGKAEVGKPIEVYNIHNGDTLQAFTVNGNAEVHIKTKASHSDLVKKESTSASFIGKLKDFSENIVKENNIKERVREVKEKNKDIKTNGFQAGVWVWLGVITIAWIIVFAIYKYIKRK